MNCDSRLLEHLDQPSLALQRLELCCSPNRTSADDNVGERVVLRTPCEKPLEIHCVRWRKEESVLESSQDWECSRRRSTSTMCGLGESRYLRRRAFARCECLQMESARCRAKEVKGPHGQVVLLNTTTGTLLTSRSTEISNALFLPSPSIAP